MGAYCFFLWHFEPARVKLKIDQFQLTDNTFSQLGQYASSFDNGLRMLLKALTDWFNWT